MHHHLANLLPAEPNTLAILGDLPASTTLHLARLSHPADHVLVLSPRPSWLTTGTESWLITDAGKAGSIVRMDQIHIRHTPTPSHLALLLSLLAIANNPSPDPSQLSQRPGLIILHQLSSFFSSDRVDGAASPWTPRSTASASQYGTLISLTISTLSKLNASLPPSEIPTQLILLDTHPPNATLPIHPGQPDQIRIDHIARHLIDWVAVVQRGPTACRIIMPPKEGSQAPRSFLLKGEDEWEEDPTPCDS